MCGEEMLVPGIFYFSLNAFKRKVVKVKTHGYF